MAGWELQDANAVSIGANAGRSTQGEGAVALGYSAGAYGQLQEAIAIGKLAGNNNQQTQAIAVGPGAGLTDQAVGAIAIGSYAGGNQESGAIAIGIDAAGYAAFGTQKANAIAIGVQAGSNTQGLAAIAIGHQAGLNTQGNYAIAIGANAGITSQHANSIILNASGANLNSDGANRLFVAPIRVATTGNTLYYNSTTKEMSYGAVGVGSSGYSGFSGASTSGYSGFSSFSGYSGVSGYSGSTTSLISNGTSNVNIATSGGNITMGVAGNADIIITTGTGANITGYANVTGNISGGNVSVSGNFSGNTNGFTIGYLDLPQVAVSNVTLGLSDRGKHYYSTASGANNAILIPNNATTGFSTGTEVTFVMQGTGNILINADTGVTLYLASNATAANRVITTYGKATLLKVATDTWFIDGTGVT